MSSEPRRVRTTANAAVTDIPSEICHVNLNEVTA
jgi:hypothetical protein